MKLTYLGTNTLLLTKSGSSLLIDPDFTRPSLLNLLGKIRPDPQAVEAGLASIEQLVGVLLTHTHYDHALDAAEILHQTGGRCFSSASGANLIRGYPLDETFFEPVSPIIVYRIGSFQVCFHPSQHITFPPPFRWLLPKTGQITQPLQPPAWFWEYRCGSVYAIQVDHMLIFGSAGFEPGAYQDVEVKCVVMGIGGLDLMPKPYLDRLYQETILPTGAKQVYLSHWDNFFRPLLQDGHPHILARRSIGRLKALGARYGQTVSLLKIGETITKW
jgi:L-ascorbate metabolism protein UlaG (beta-lactamase superfamily)